MREHCEEAFKLYKSFLANHMPRELARSVLPMNTYTRFFGTVNLHNLFRFIGLRHDEHAQYEIRVYAQAMMDMLEEITPIAVKHFRENFLR